MCNIDIHVIANFKKLLNLLHKIHAIKCFIFSYAFLGSLCWRKVAVYFTMHTSAGSPLYKYLKSVHNARKMTCGTQFWEHRRRNCECWVQCKSLCCRHSSELTKQNCNQPEDKVKMQILNCLFFAMIFVIGDDFSQSIGEDLVVILMDRGSWWAIVHRVANSQKWLSNWYIYIYIYTYLNIRSFLAVQCLRLWTSTPGCGFNPWSGN